MRFRSKNKRKIGRRLLTCAVRLHVNNVSMRTSPTMYSLSLLLKVHQQVVDLYLRNLVLQLLQNVQQQSRLLNYLRRLSIVSAMRLRFSLYFHLDVYAPAQ